MATRAFYRLGFAHRLKDPELTGTIEAAFEKGIRTTQNVDMSLEKAVQDPDGRIQIENLLAQCQQLKILIGGRLPRAINVPLGFNGLDGD